MGEWIELEAADGHHLSAWRETPTGIPRGGVVVVQEIFGVNDHIRDVTGRFAAAGYQAIAPALFDRYERGWDRDYSAESVAAFAPIRDRLDFDQALLDVEAAVVALSPAGRTAVVGFCLGGSLAWLAAARLPIAAAVGYYGGQILDDLDLQPKVPVLLHFGNKDPYIPMDGVERLRQIHPQMAIYDYAAGHGFSCDQRASYDETAHRQAWSRSLEFLARHLG